MGILDKTEEFIAQFKSDEKEVNSLIATFNQVAEERLIHTVNSIEPMDLVVKSKHCSGFSFQTKDIIPRHKERFVMPYTKLVEQFADTSETIRECRRVAKALSLKVEVVEVNHHQNPLMLIQFSPIVPKIK